LVTLKAKDLPLLQQLWCVFLWWKLPVTRLGLLLSQRWLVCEFASVWEKPQVTQPLKAMQRCRLPGLSCRLSYAPAFWLALPQAIRLDWATGLAQYKLQQTRLQ
jgi:hypothetical protein